MLSPPLLITVPLFFIIYFFQLFLSACLSGWVFLTSCASQPIAELISPWLSLCLSPCLFAHLSRSLLTLTPLLYRTLCCHRLAGPQFNIPPSALPSFLSFFTRTLSPCSQVLGLDFFLLHLSPYPVLALPRRVSSKELGNPALHATSGCGLFLTNPANPRLRTDTMINSQKFQVFTCACIHRYAHLHGFQYTNQSICAVRHSPAKIKTTSIFEYKSLFFLFCCCFFCRFSQISVCISQKRREKVSEASCAFAKIFHGI